MPRVLEERRTWTSDQRGPPSASSDSPPAQAKGPRVKQMPRQHAASRRHQPSRRRRTRSTLQNSFCSRCVGEDHHRRGVELCGSPTPGSRYGRSTRWSPPSATRCGMSTASGCCSTRRGAARSAPEGHAHRAAQRLRRRRDAPRAHRVHAVGLQRGRLLRHRKSRRARRRWARASTPSCAARSRTTTTARASSSTTRCGMCADADLDEIYSGDEKALVTAAFAQALETVVSATAVRNPPFPTADLEERRRAARRDQARGGGARARRCRRRGIGAAGARYCDALHEPQA